MSKTRAESFKFYGGLFVVVLGSCILFVASSIHGPDAELHFTREVPSELSPAHLSRVVSAPSRWPQWFYSLAEAKPQENESEQSLHAGSRITLHMNPGKGDWKRFDLSAEVTRYDPGHQIEIRILDDSSGRITRLFDFLEWKVELVPRGEGSLIRGTAIAHTRHWRARLFGRLAEKIVMNQLFYPDLVKLAELKQPFSLEVPPQNQQRSAW